MMDALLAVILFWGVVYAAIRLIMALFFDKAALLEKAKQMQGVTTNNDSSNTDRLDVLNIDIDALAARDRRERQRDYD